MMKMTTRTGNIIWYLPDDEDPNLTPHLWIADSKNRLQSVILEPEEIKGFVKALNYNAVSSSEISATDGWASIATMELPEECPDWLQKLIRLTTHKFLTVPKHTKQVNVAISLLVFHDEVMSRYSKEKPKKSLEEYYNSLKWNVISTLSRIDGGLSNISPL